MSGRGRGRGRGSISQSKLLLKRSAQEAGLDNDRQMVSLQEIIRPSLFPDFHWHSSGRKNLPSDQEASMVKIEEGEQSKKTEVNIVKRPANHVAIIQKQRQMIEAFSKTAHQVRETKNVDVARYGKQTIATAPDQAVLLSMKASEGESSQNKLATDERYFPAELLSTLKQLQSARRAQNPEKKTLTALLEDEEDNVILSDNEDDEEEDDEDLPAPEELEADDIEDYTTNYYNTDDESDGAGDAEATF